MLILCSSNNTDDVADDNNDTTKLMKMSKAYVTVCDNTSVIQM